jgi:crotonobetainyl-CoA:carnitine CoA-transferase CaiB-like acyl-CoA transferase
MIVPYRGYASKDGFIVVAAGNDKLFASLARVLGHPQWIDDPRFRTNPDRGSPPALGADNEEILGGQPAAAMKP